MSVWSVDGYILRIISLNPPRQELGASALISGTCASLPANTVASEEGSQGMKPVKNTGHGAGGGQPMNSDKVRKEVGPAGSHEFLYLVEGRSTESHPHADSMIQERCCVRVTRLLRSVGNRACLQAHG